MAHLIGIMLVTGMSCVQVSEKIENVKAYDDLSPSIKEEIIEVYKEYMIDVLGVDCQWDAND